jgi:hypothetical protein
MNGAPMASRGLTKTLVRRRRSWPLIRVPFPQAHIDQESGEVARRLSTEPLRVCFLRVSAVITLDFPTSETPIRTRVTGARRRRVLPRGDRSSWPGQAGAKHLDPLAGMIVPEAIVIEDLEEPDERQNAE